MLAFLVLHVVGLLSVIAVSVVYGMWDLVIINSLVFLVLIRLEMVLCAKRYTVPLPVYADGTVGNVKVEEPEPKPVESVQPSAESQPEEVVPESMIASDIGVAAAA